MKTIVKMTASLLFLVSTAAIADPTPRPSPWFQVTQWFFSPLQVRMWGPNSYNDFYPWTGLYFRGGDLPDPYPSPELQSGTVYTIDLTPFGVGSDATVAFLTGMAIISNNNTPALGEIRVTMARHGSAIDCSKYMGQAVTYSVPWEEIRSNMAMFVPLNQGKFDYCIIKGSNGSDTPGITYGINLTLQMWGR